MRLIFPIYLLISINTFAQVNLVKTKINKNISVSLPQIFSPMTPEDLIQRYPSVRAPLGAYTDSDRLADFSVNISATQWPDQNLDFARSFFKSSIMNMFDRVEVLGEGIREIKDNKFIFFEFTSRLNPEKQNIATQDALVRYTYIMYLIRPKQTLVFSFTCTKDVQETWQPVAREIMNTIQVR
jgi:hypothetical protein